MKNLATQLREKTMKKIAVYLVLSACLLMAPEAWAAWGSFISTGTGVGSPSCTALGTGQVVCVVIGINNMLTSVVGP